MLLTVVGSAPAWTRRVGVPSSCYLVELDNSALVLDMGQGSFAALSQWRDPASVAAYLVSHLHPDHCVDLIPLRHYLRYEVGGRAPAVRLVAPGEIRRRFDVLFGQQDFLRDLVGEALEPGALDLPPFAVRAERVTHTDSSFGFRVAPLSNPDAPGLVYSGDCAREADLLPLLLPGDTLLCEAAFGAGDAGSGGHLGAAQAALAAREGGAARLVLTHVFDGRDPQAVLETARERFEGEVLLAEPGLRLRIS